MKVLWKELEREQNQKGGDYIKCTDLVTDRVFSSNCKLLRHLGTCQVPLSLVKNQTDVSDK